MSNEIEITVQTRTVAEHVASHYLDVSEAEAEELAENDVFVHLSAAHDHLFVARGDSVGGSEADGEIVDLTTAHSSDISYLMHVKAEEILDREISTPEPTDGGEARE